MQEKLIQIAHYIDNYEKNKSSEVLHYYNIFELKQANDVNLITEDIKKKRLKILFHPDLLAYIPEQHKKSFGVLSDAVKDMENVFSTRRSKEIYDENLKKVMIKRENEKKENFNQNNELETFNDIVTTNIKKYGFRFTGEGIGMIIRSNNFRGMTKTGNCRMKAINLGKEKIQAIINCFIKQNSKSANLNANIINYYSFLMYQKSELKEMMDVYVDACLKTAAKYDFDQLSFAIEEAQRMYYNDSESKDCYKGFTNTNQARRKLTDLVNPNDIALLSRIYLNINAYDKYQNDELATLSDRQIIGEFLGVLEQQLNKENFNKYSR